MLPRVLDDIVARDGWPHPQSIDRASEARLWILLLHCDRGQRTRRRLLALARPTIADAGADPYAYALAVDRTEALHASRQVYGTMLVAPGGAFEVPLIDPREVDARRDAVGLPPLQRDLDSGITSDSIAARLASQSFDETST
jgi:hypothetical protein